MIFPKDLPSDHSDYEFHGQSKGMQWILEEHCLLTALQAANNGQIVGECQTCKLLQEAQDQLHYEALAVLEYSGEPSKLHTDVIDESMLATCYMQKMIAN